MRFLRFQVIFGHVANAANSAQNYPKLPKSVQSQNFEIPPKIEILVFLKNKSVEEALKHVSIIRILQSKNFPYAIFSVKKRPLYVNFSIPPCGN
jgi:hypothetical protein